MKDVRNTKGTRRADKTNGNDAARGTDRLQRKDSMATDTSERSKSSGRRKFTVNDIGRRIPKISDLMNSRQMQEMMLNAETKSAKRTATQRVFKFELSTEKQPETRTDTASAKKDFEETFEILNGLMGGALLKIDPLVGKEIMEDDQLMLELENYLKYKKGKIVFSLLTEPGVYPEQRTIVAEAYHLNATARADEDHDLYDVLCSAFALKPDRKHTQPPKAQNKLDTVPIQNEGDSGAGAIAKPAPSRVRDNVHILERLGGDALEFVDLADVQKIERDHRLTTALANFETELGGTITVDEDRTPGMQTGDDTIVVHASHLNAFNRASDANAPRKNDLYQELCKAFGLKPMPDAAPESELREILAPEIENDTSTEGIDAEDVVTEPVVAAKTPYDSTVQKEIDDMDNQENKFKTVKELWESRVTDNEELPKLL
ncbi:MAG: hypothetical protein AAFP85_15675 [Pseudomonadota bacterium]